MAENDASRAGDDPGSAREPGLEADRPAVPTIVGLGNPGGRYEATRHNLGFRVVEELMRRHGSGPEGRECNARVSRAGDLELVRPQTYMNRSGHSARCLVERRGIEPRDFLVVYDDIHLPLGRLRLRRSGSPGGHRGMESVLESLGTDRIPRLRMGVKGEGAPEGEALVDYVLAEFLEGEYDAVEAMIRRAADACEAWAAKGIEMAMQSYNG